VLVVAAPVIPKFVVVALPVVVELPEIVSPERTVEDACEIKLPIVKSPLMVLVPDALIEVTVAKLDQIELPDPLPTRIELVKAVLALIPSFASSASIASFAFECCPE